MKNTQDTFSTRLRRLLERDKTTPEKVATGNAIPLPRINAFLKGRTQPSNEEAESLADFFMVPQEWLTRGVLWEIPRRVAPIQKSLMRQVARVALSTVDSMSHLDKVTLLHGLGEILEGEEKAIAQAVATSFKESSSGLKLLRLKLGV